jgi:hypothetical protein
MHGSEPPGRNDDRSRIGFGSVPRVPDAFQLTMLSIGAIVMSAFYVARPADAYEPREGEPPR